MFRILTITAVFGLLAIILGALGAHALKDVLTSDQLDSYKTGIFYQLIHVIVILILFAGPFLSVSESKKVSIIFLLGIVFFSGSIYAIHLTPITAKSIWFITPLGGLFFMAGWAYMFYIFFKKSLQKRDS